MSKALSRGNACNKYIDNLKKTLSDHFIVLFCRMTSQKATDVDAKMNEMQR